MKFVEKFIHGKYQSTNQPTNQPINQSMKDYIHDDDFEEYFKKRKIIYGNLSVLSGKCKASRHIKILIGFGASKTPVKTLIKNSPIKTPVNFKTIIPKNPIKNTPIKKIQSQSKEDEIIHTHTYPEKPKLKPVVQDISVVPQLDISSSYVIQKIQPEIKKRIVTAPMILCRFGEQCYKQSCPYAHSIKEMKIEPCKFKNRCNRVTCKRNGGRYENQNGSLKCLRLHPGETVDMYVYRNQKN